MHDALLNSNSKGIGSCRDILENSHASRRKWNPGSEETDGTHRIVAGCAPCGRARDRGGIYGN